MGEFASHISIRKCRWCIPKYLQDVGGGVFPNRFLEGEGGHANLISHEGQRWACQPHLLKKVRVGHISLSGGGHASSRFCLSGGGHAYSMIKIGCDVWRRWALNHSIHLPLKMKSFITQ